MNKVASLIVAYVLLCTTQRVQVLMPLFGVSSFYVHLFVCARVWAKQTFSNITKLNLSIVTGVLFGCFSSQMFLFNCVVSVHWTSHVEMAFFSQMLCHTCPIWILYSLFWLRGGWAGLTHLSSSLLLPPTLLSTSHSLSPRWLRPEPIPEFLSLRSSSCPGVFPLCFQVIRIHAEFCVWLFLSIVSFECVNAPWCEICFFAFARSILRFHEIRTLALRYVFGVHCEL